MIDQGVAIGFFTPYPNRITGLSSYTSSLLRALQVCAGRILLITNATFEVVPPAENVDLQILSGHGSVPYKLRVLWLHQRAVSLAKSRGCVAYVSTTPIGALLPVLPQVVTWHDLYDLTSLYRPLRTVLYSAVIWRSVASRSRKVVAVSMTTAKAIRSRFPTLRKKIHVIREGSKFSARSVPFDEVVPNNFLFVANIQPNKNVECLLRASRRLEKEDPTVRVQWVGVDIDGTIDKWVSRHGSLPNFDRCGRVDDEELMHLYRTASALIVTSTDEGFCLPVVEAQSFGTPVIASDIPILREVAGSGALFFPCDNDAELCGAMRMMATQSGMRRELSQSALLNAAQYSWDTAAEELLSLVGSVSSRA